MTTIDQILGRSSFNSIEEKQAIVELTRVVVMALAELPEGIPAGHMYALMMNKFSSVDAFESFLGMLKRTGFITRKGDLVMAARFHDIAGVRP